VPNPLKQKIAIVSSISMSKISIGMRETFSSFKVYAHHLHTESLLNFFLLGLGDERTLIHFKKKLDLKKYAQV